MHAPTRRRPWRSAAAAASVACLVLGACAGDEPGSTPRITPGTSDAPRAVNVIAREWTFLPPVVDLVPGETVVLHVVNGGTEIHEAILGGPAVQAAWEAAEAAAANPPPGPTPAVSVAPDVAGLRVVVASGQRQDVTWTVPDEPASDFLVGCHIPGHFERGMAVPVRWVGPDGVPLDDPDAEASPA